VIAFFYGTETETETQAKEGQKLDRNPQPRVGTPILYDIFGINLNNMSD
jgi:hypothetical protein